MEFVFKKLTARPELSIVVLSLLLLLPGNWILPLTDRDEARFAEASREMLLRRDFVVPWFNDQWRLYKPALIYWCQLASYLLLGANDFTARLPSVLFTTATALLLVRWGQKVADAKTGFIAGAMFVAGLHVAIIGRVATADLALFFFFALSTWTGWELTRPEQPQRKKWWWLFYVSLALGFLTKGPEAWLPLAGMFLGRALRKDSFRLPLGETVTGLCLAVALVGLWGIPATIQTKGEFFRFGLGDQVLNRAVEVKDSHGLKGILGYVLALPLYLVTFFISFFPWSTRVPGALRWWWPNRSRDDLGWYLLVIAASVFVVFTLVKTKLPHYTMPAFPCLALWLARQIGPDKKIPIWFTARLVGVTAFILSVTLIGFSLAKDHLLTQNVWTAVQSHVRPETRVGCFGYTEPSLVWRFRAVTTNHVTLAGVGQVKNFLTNPPPMIIVLPTKELAQVSQTNGPQFQVHGFDMVAGKNWDLTVLIR